MSGLWRPSVNSDDFERERLPAAVERFLRSVNPWWQGRPGPRIPAYRRWAFATVLRKLERGLAPVIVIRGPRQVGKTTLQLQIIAHLIVSKSVDARRILRVQFDEIPSLGGLRDPILAVTRWFETEVLGESFNEAAARQQPACLFFDEVQNLRDWAPQLKALVDHNTVRAFVTGSSALRIEAGRDSLAGRITQIDLGTLLLREIIGLRFGETIPPHLPDNGMEPMLSGEFWRELQAYGLRNRDVRDRAFVAFSRRGGYPVAQAHPDTPWHELADHLNETVIRRVIEHDLRMDARGQKRDEQLLEEVFRLCCRHAGQAPGQAVFVPEIQQALHADAGWQRIRAYLRFLEGALLVRVVDPLELRLKRRKGHSKICICDHALRASWLQETVPLDAAGLASSPHLSDLAGHLAESVAGFFLAGLPHLDLAHFPERGAEPEVDFVLTIGEMRVPVEVKYRRIVDAHRATLGLRAFIEKTVYNAPFGILVTLTDGVKVADPRIVPVSLPSLLLMR